MDWLREDPAPHGIGGRGMFVKMTLYPSILLRARTVALKGAGGIVVRLAVGGWTCALEIGRPRECFCLRAWGLGFP